MSFRLSHLRLSLPKTAKNEAAITERSSTPTVDPSKRKSVNPGSSVASSSMREQMVLFVKIFFIMGLSFFTEVLHIALHRDHRKMKRCSYELEVRRQEHYNMAGVAI